MLRNNYPNREKGCKQKPPIGRGDDAMLAKCIRNG